ncbi:porin [Paragemmobacter straminiformis]|uniref:Porin n=1 Tax=Paragemmobacter straminiformis TaxID=2045119 RepID=A0A842I941_9RHOB|nr:porin [Gemmobacter straminiformis]MBC2836149.1 porin [Gemmobacter straminiformis]
MKKILLATTVLVGTAGFAAAEVTLSGDARMGIVNDGDTTEFSSRARVAFTLSGETDGGLSFGASFRADNAVGANGNTDTTDGSVFISGAFGKLSMGNVAGAAEAAVGDLSGVGYTGLGDFSDTVYLTGDGAEGEPIVQYAYTAGDLSVYASASDGAQVSNYALGLGYKMGDYNFGIGYESTDDGLFGDDATHVVASAGGTFGAVSAKVVYGQADLGSGFDLTQYGLSATYSADALAVTGYYKVVDTDFIAGETTAVGLGASYDLGGGASVKGGVVNVDNEFLGDNTAYDLGVTFSF